MTVPIAVGAALVLSHLAAIPALVYLGLRHLINETVVLATAVAISTAYHLCQVEWICFGLELQALQISDHFMVFFALVWFLLYAAGSTERVRAAVTIAIMGISLPVIISNLDSWIAGAMVVGLGITAFLITFLAYSTIRGGVKIEWRAFAVALALIGIGVVLHVYAGDFGPDNTIYPIAHSVWHVLAFFSLYYIAMIPHIDTSILQGDAWIRVGDHVRDQRRQGKRKEVATRAGAARRQRESMLPETVISSRPMGVGAGTVLSLNMARDL